MALISNEIYLVSAFDDNPEFFLVEFTFEHKTTFEKKYSHIMGRIFNDEYYELEKFILEFTECA